MSFSVGNSFVVDSSRNIILGRLEVDPGSAAAGTILFNNGLGVVRGWNGTQWVSLTQGATASQAWSWGSNSGQLGDGTVTNRSSPVSVVGGFTDWTQISAGIFHTVGIRSGQAWAWGAGSDGRLGSGTTTNTSSPVPVVGGFTDWLTVSASSGRHSAGVRTNGQAWCWGYNTDGQLGNGATVTTSSPVSVVGGFTDWIQISGGGYHTVGLRTNGQAWAWGFNGSGQLGDNTTVRKSSPVSVVGGFTDWIQITARGSQSGGVRTNGQTWTWGGNGSGQLGDGTVTNRSSPVLVVGDFTDWTQISMGNYHTIGLRVNGQVWAWGSNGNGELGNNSLTGTSSPVSLAGGITDWVQISAGNGFTAALRANGQAWAWGGNGSGQLGDGTVTNRSSPVLVVGGFTNWIDITSGSSHTVAVRITA